MRSSEKVAKLALASVIFDIVVWICISILQNGNPDRFNRENIVAIYSVLAIIKVVLFGLAGIMYILGY
jgi:hypothetical protein